MDLSPILCVAPPSLVFGRFMKFPNTAIKATGYTSAVLASLVDPAPYCYRWGKEEVKLGRG